MRFRLSLVLLSLFVSGYCYAQIFTGTGTINQLRVQ